MTVAVTPPSVPEIRYLIARLLLAPMRIPRKSAADSDRNRPPIPMEADR
jgi:hypothetical protein